MKVKLSYSLVVAGLLACALLVGCGEDPERIVSPSDSGWLDNTGFATGLDQPTVSDDGGTVVIEDDYVTEEDTDNNTLVLPDDEEDDPIVEEDTGSETVVND